MLYIYISIFCIVALEHIYAIPTNSKIDVENINIEAFSKRCVASVQSIHKGDSGRIAIIGGSTRIPAATYFTTISAIKAGAECVMVITTEAAAPIISSYSPNLMVVLPILDKKNVPQIRKQLQGFSIDLVVIGPGIEHRPEETTLIYDTINICKEMMIPLIIDSTALSALSKNLSIIDQYPSPGVILTPNYKEAELLRESISKESNITNWYNYWGDNVSVLAKGKEDKFYSGDSSVEWGLEGGGSNRRVVGQGNILAGILATFYNWAINSKGCSNLPVQLAKSLAANAAASVMRKCNSLAYSKHGRSMVPTDMVNEIHSALEMLINNHTPHQLIYAPTEGLEPTLN